MRILLLIPILCCCQFSLSAQTLPEWYRVYTFEDSKIEMNTSLVTSISKDVNRVRFRWSFDNPQTLPGARNSNYQIELEVLEINCSEKSYRPYHVTYYDQSNNILRIEDTPGKWRRPTNWTIMGRLLTSGCDLIKERSVTPGGEDESESDKGLLYANEFYQYLQQTRDFKPVIQKFFVADYLQRYVDNGDDTWLYNLSRDTAAKVSQAELERFYIAMMNSAYLTSTYLISQLPSFNVEPDSPEKLLPNDVLQLVKNHPYTLKYKTQDNYDFLNETIRDVDRLEAYTDFLEDLTSIMRRHLVQLSDTHKQQYLRRLRRLGAGDFSVRICGDRCLGLPKGTRVFEIDIPVFHLEIAEIDGSLKVVSAITSF